MLLHDSPTALAQPSAMVRVDTTLFSSHAGPLGGGSHSLLALDARDATELTRGVRPIHLPRATVASSFARPRSRFAVRMWGAGCVGGSRSDFSCLITPMPVGCLMKCWSCRGDPWAGVLVGDGDGFACLCLVGMQSQRARFCVNLRGHEF